MAEEGDDYTASSSTHMSEPAKLQNYFDYLATLTPRKKELYTSRRKAKIMCTIGQASRSVEVILKLIECGMNVARVRLGTGSYEHDKGTIENIRTAINLYSEKIGRNYHMAIACDLIGPDVKVGFIETGLPYIMLKEGDNVEITVNDEYKDRCNAERIYVDFATLPSLVSIGNEIYINNGKILLEVTTIADHHRFTCKVVKGGKYSSKDSLNFPSLDVDLPDFTEKDLLDLDFCIEQKIDMIIMSFTRHAQTISYLRERIEEEDCEMAIIAKIEDIEGIENFHDIALYADGICLGRSDLGINVTVKKLCLYQKSLIARCNKIGKPCIITGHVLASLNRKLGATRNEASDICNTILDGADMLILDRVIFSGMYPVESLVSCVKLIRAAESAIWKRRTFADICYEFLPPMDGARAIALAAAECAGNVKATALIVITRSGRSARYLAQLRPPCHIIAVVKKPFVAKLLLLYKGIEPIIPPPSTERMFLRDLEDQLQYAVRICLLDNLVALWDKIVFVVPSSPGDGFSNVIKVYQIKRRQTSILY